MLKKTETHLSQNWHGLKVWCLTPELPLLCDGGWTRELQGPFQPESSSDSTIASCVHCLFYRKSHIKHLPKSLLAAIPTYCKK